MLVRRASEGKICKRNIMPPLSFAFVSLSKGAW
jgi:hypothetical protein